MSTIAFKIGSLVQDSVAGLKALAAFATATNYMTLEIPVGTDYQVPVGKTFYITKVSYSVSTANEHVIIGYGDTGIPDQAAPPTNYVALTAYLQAPAAYTIYERDLFLAIPAQKYPCVKAGTAGLYALIHGIEV